MKNNINILIKKYHNNEQKIRQLLNKTTCSLSVLKTICKIAITNSWTSILDQILNHPKFGYNIFRWILQSKMINSTIILVLLRSKFINNQSVDILLQKMM